MPKMLRSMISSRSDVAPMLAPMMSPRLICLLNVVATGGIVIKAAGIPSSNRHWETEKLERS